MVLLRFLGCRLSKQLVPPKEIEGQLQSMAQVDQVSFPFRVTVEEVISSRYSDHRRPSSWDERKAGLDIVRTTEGSVLRLLSDGGQSPPKSGWTLIVSEGEPEQGFRWTLFGMPRGSGRLDS